LKGNILITGGAGFIGSNIVNALAQMPECSVSVFDIRGEDGKIGNVVNVRGNIFDFSRLMKLMSDQDIDNVIHLIGLVSIVDCEKSPDLSFQLNVSSVHNILEAMRLSDAERLIFPSTAVVYGAVNDPKVSEEAKPNPTTVYGTHKLAAESLIREYAESYGLNATILRIFNVYGDLETEHGVVSLFVKRALARKPLIVEGGEQLRDFVHLNDVVKAFTRSLDIPAACRKIINVGSGVGLSVKEVANMVKQSFPKAELQYESSREGECSIFADVSRMKTILAFDPIDPKKGIQAFIEKCLS